MADSDDFLPTINVRTPYSYSLWDKTQESTNANRQKRLRAVFTNGTIIYNGTETVTWSDEIRVYFPSLVADEYRYNTISAGNIATSGDYHVLYVKLVDTDASVITMQSIARASFDRAGLSNDTGDIVIIGMTNDTTFFPVYGGGGGLYDDTPVNAELNKGITSNWAYDHSTANPNAHHAQSHDNTDHTTNYETANANIQSHVGTPPTDSHHTRYTDSEAKTATVSDVAYNSTSWDAIVDIAPSKNAVRDELEVHYAAANPHSVTATQVGLGNVDNIADASQVSLGTVTSGDIDAIANYSTRASLGLDITDAVRFRELDLNATDSADRIVGFSNSGTGVYNFQTDGYIKSFGFTVSQIVETDANKILVSVAKGTAYNKAFGVSVGTVSEGDHTHAGASDPAFKNVFGNLHWATYWICPVDWTLYNDGCSGTHLRIHYQVDTGNTNWIWRESYSAGDSATSDFWEIYYDWVCPATGTYRFSCLVYGSMAITPYWDFRTGYVTPPGTGFTQKTSVDVNSFHGAWYIATWTQSFTASTTYRLKMRTAATANNTNNPAYIFFGSVGIAMDNDLT